ncbi:tetratricopeptide repeat protein [Sandaracinobacteroides sp. A072]|uniref:tetratricopeptide repeat protein n=1 Tax=Sandaracinobacteroides sp. A072 TaxID=3461146 RepID=UPI0040413F44
MIARSILIAALLAGPATAQGVVAASQAQVTQIDKRVTTLEGQMRAVQRQVFPGGDKRFFAPEVTPEQPAAAAPGTPATAPLVDLTQRVTALETQQRDLTGQIERLQFQIRQMETALTKLRGDTEFRLDALEGKGADGTATPAAGGTGTGTGTGAGTVASATAASPAKAGGAATPVPAARAPEKAATATTAANTATAAATPAEDPGEAAYVSGYQLYTKGDHAGAIKTLTAFLEANPKHRRASNAQFWIGRSMMAQDKTAEAAKAFLSGYQKYPRGDRAHNSLLWLGKALLKLKQPKAACQALDQLQTAYPDRLTGQVAVDAKATRAEAGCGA